MIDTVVTDLIQHSLAALVAERPADIDAVRALPRPLVSLSDTTASRHRELKQFLNNSLYKHERVVAMTRRANQIVEGLFETYINDVHAMPRDHAVRAQEWNAETGPAGRARAVADYVAGMTDRYAYSEYRRLVDSEMTLERVLRIIKRVTEK